ncbi:MAG: rod shape-determining protein MreD [Deltaproteobacteria bacterium]|jgi:rod shape-determining protein MreD|nr:rod shape-determining protein MreD [Deltaproteobacteria bacterium]MBW2520366.1 rod shape-determining protein MreD [Deltaproteobacteria bacterium]
MNRFLLYIIAAILSVVLQATFLTKVFPGHYKPDLLLILVVFLGFNEKSLQGGALVYCLGWFYDGFAGTFPGLHGFVLLSVFLAVRAIVSRVNTESYFLILLVVATGTLLQYLMTSFALDFFRITYPFILKMLWEMIVQVFLNTLIAFILICFSLWFQRSVQPRLRIFVQKRV